MADANHKHFNALVELSVAEERIKKAKESLEQGLVMYTAASIRDATINLVEASFLVSSKTRGP